ncbi:MAG: hypothetical protein US54_C0012G0051 [Candidatus Roizmanbacteria bacterium GW2011_GWA2_37_7]|uniref:Uncharacterized protein n=1 Tax=Candidatus Roizmanbacteria bacterium GW2011_GWA2_37_7 TaxID=1618481 RepID=A0A0G0JNA3_9BACT|nr:MAG: hypothetical protein US54_C0012G0051 [Candidatus Roizmanbacteria bacterium GW2011_GWA2_37_7]
MKQKDLLIISLTIFLTVIAWVMLELKSIREQTPTDTQIESYSLDYNVDTKILKVLEEKKP